MAPSSRRIGKPMYSRAWGPYLKADIWTSPRSLRGLRPGDRRGRWTCWICRARHEGGASPRSLLACARDLLMYLQRLRNGPCGTLRSGGYRREKLVDFRLQAGAVVREQPR